MGAIAKSLREVEGRSLRCLEREMAIQRREARLEERENDLRIREMRARSMREAINELDDMPPLESTQERIPKHKQRVARNMRTIFPFPAMEMRRVPFPMRFVNKKGKEYYCYVDDVSAPIDKAGFIREVWPAREPPVKFNNTRNVPWLHKRDTRAQRWNEVRKNFHMEPKHSGPESDDEDKRNGQRKRGKGGRGRAKRLRGDGAGCNPNHHGIKKRREEDDDAGRT